jgi:hypothetical protein
VGCYGEHNPTGQENSAPGDIAIGLIALRSCCTRDPFESFLLLESSGYVIGRAAVLANAAFRVRTNHTAIVNWTTAFSAELSIQCPCDRLTTTDALLARKLRHRDSLRSAGTIPANAETCELLDSTNLLRSTGAMTTP